MEGGRDSPLPLGGVRVRVSLVMQLGTGDGETGGNSYSQNSHNATVSTRP